MIRAQFLKFLLLVCCCFQSTFSQNPSALYQDWLDSQSNGSTSILPTFSYAGYKHGEEGVPFSFSQQVYDVTQSPFNAIADDGISDKQAIMAAIAAAESNPNGGIVFFPPGRFDINDATVDDTTEIIKITKSNIILKGSGSGAGGTELYQKDYTDHPDKATKSWACPYLIQFTNNEDSQNTFITDVVSDADRETYTVQVTSTSNITVGQWIELYVKNKDADLLAEELAPFTANDLYQPSSLKIVNDGVLIREIHKVVSKTENTITFKEPIHRAINASYNWKVNNFKALEAVGVQDLKYVGAYTYNFLHHRAPQELYPGEPEAGPHAYMSDSGWSGIKFNHVANGWIKNVTFSAVSQAAMFQFSGYCSAIDNHYVGNPGHNFITSQNSTGCLIGRNHDDSSGIWHGCGVSASSIANVMWRNIHPANGNSGMEVHASQPRSNLFDFCKGGFFTKFGGATSSLPNHLKHLVLWNFEGVSYKGSNVKSWRSNSDNRYQKFITPIVSGLKGFTLSTAANQFQVNESQGVHVDETSLYESQLAYRLGALPSWITNTETSIVLYAEDFGADNGRGFSKDITSDAGHPDGDLLLKRVSDIPDANDSNPSFDDEMDRNELRIPNGGVRNQLSLSFSGTKNFNGQNTNFAVDARAVFTPLNLSSSNLSNEDSYVYASFWTQRRYGDGDIANVTIEISTDYSGDASTATWQTLPIHSGKLGTTSDQRKFVKGIVDLSAFANTSESSNVTLALHYQGSDAVWTNKNRNGTFYIADLQFFIQNTPLKDNWSGALSSDYLNPSNWTQKAVPNSASNTIVIPKDAENFPTLDSSVVAKEIKLQSGATLIANENVNATVTYEIELSNTWELLAVPTVGSYYDTSWSDANAIDYTTEGDRAIATYDNANTSNYWSYSEGTQANFEAGNGYLVKRASAGVVSFEGSLQTSDVENVVLSKGLTDFNLIGNPFTAYINSNELLKESNNSSLLASETLWVLDTITGAYEAKLSEDIVPIQIAPGQGFFVETASDGNFIFKASQRKHKSDNQDVEVDYPEIRILANANGLERFASVRFRENASKGFDNGMDGKVFSGVATDFDLYTELLEADVDGKYQVQTVPNSGYESMVFPLGVTSSADTSVTFTANSLNIPSGFNVYLEDRTHGTTTVLSDADTSYTTDILTSGSTGRFYLHLKTNFLSNENKRLEHIVVYKTREDRLRLLGLKKGNTHIVIYDMLGKKVFEKETIVSADESIALPKVKKGIYLISLKTAEGSLVRKILL
ncbi:MAG: DUF4955 domain-containing protein [Flavicella sp.]